MQKNFNLVWQNTLETKNSDSKPHSISLSSNIIKQIITKGNDLKEQTIVIKLDSVTIQNPFLMQNFIENIHIMTSCSAKVIIVHDYSNLVEHTLKLFEMNENIINNFKPINNKNSQIIEMVLSGYINKNIVSKLCEAGCYAIGISGKDGNLIQAKKSKLLHKRLDEEDIIDIGYICEPIIINPEVLLSFEDMDIIPVISPIANDENQNTHILDVDLTASAIATFLNADHLILTLPKELLLKENNFRSNDFKFLKNILNPNNQSTKNILDAANNFLELGNNNYLHLVDAEVPDNILLSLFAEY